LSRRPFTQTKAFRLAAETNRLAACAPQTTKSFDPFGFAQGKTFAQDDNAKRVVISFDQTSSALLRQGYLRKASASQGLLRKYFASRRRGRQEWDIETFVSFHSIERLLPSFAKATARQAGVRN
jgi:hypothetical protein